MVYKTEAKDDCRVKSEVYQVECVKCEEEGRRCVYVRQTGRSAWKRGGDHLRAWRRKEEV